MTETLHANRRADLLAERSRLVEQLRELGVSVDTDSDELAYDGGFADTAQVTAERAEVEALAGTLRDTLRDVDHAISKIEDGTYGRCEECNQPIAEARLEAMPAARFCIEHAARH
ncbi:MAG: TraR/DksA family transcriptional regulator [Acidimicrobiia bacterium]